MRKKIAIIIPGGIGVGPMNQGIPILETFIERLAKRFDLFVFPLGCVNDGYTPKGFQVIAINESYDRPILKRMIKTIRTIKKVHSKEKFDWFHGIWTFPSGFLAVLLGKIWGVDSLVSIQGGGLARVKKISYGGRMKIVDRFFIRWTLRNANHLCAETNFQKNLISDVRTRKRVSVIPYGVNIDLFKYQAKPLNEPLKIIHIANLNLVKDQKTLIRALHCIRKEIDARLTIIGPDFLNGKIQRFVHQLGLKNYVHFTGFIPHQEIPFYLHKAHMMLHTSLHEGMPLVAVEAMASGVVVCGTKVGIIADLSPNYCIGVSIGDYLALANQVIQLVKNKAQYLELQQKGREWAQQFSVDWTCGQFEKIYNSN